jgi:hypothetical protein
MRVTVRRGDETARRGDETVRYLMRLHDAATRLKNAARANAVERALMKIDRASVDE